MHCKQLCIWFIILSGSVQLTWSSSSWNWTGENLWSEVCRPWIWNFPKQFQFNISEIRQTAHPVRLHQTFETNQSTLKKTIRRQCRFPRQGFQGGPQRVDRVAVWLLAASPELWHKKCYAGLQPVDVLLSCRNHQRGEKIFFSLFFLSDVHTNSELCRQNICSFIACTLIQSFSYHG